MVGSALLQAVSAAFFFASTATATPYTRLYDRQANYTWPSEVAGQAYGPSWPQFVNKTTRWSTYEPPSFNEVFLPKTEEDVAIGLQYLSSAGKSFLVKSGGHGYSPSLHVIQNAAMINMENFDYVIMNPDHSVTVGTGARFSKLVDVVGNAGRELSQSQPHHQCALEERSI
ncbi:MAG: hypothetical protein Q9218_006936 [Villophora microphyllina]